MIKHKKKLKVKEQNKKLERNQTRLNRVLDALGVTELHKSLYIKMREFVVKYPDPPVLVDLGGKPVPEPLREVVEWWNTLTYEGISSAEFLEVLRPLIRCIRSSLGEEC